MKTFTVTLMGAIYMSYVCNFDFLNILWLCVNFGNSFFATLERDCTLGRLKRSINKICHKIC